MGRFFEIGVCNISFYNQCLFDWENLFSFSFFHYLLIILGHGLRFCLYFFFFLIFRYDNI